jgi:hypothetical protein
MAKEAKLVCKNSFKNTEKSTIAAELTEKIVRLICRMESCSLVRKT